MVRIIKENIKLLIGIVIGAIIFGGGVYASSIAAKDASYENKSSGLSSTNIQDAVDELYTKTKNLKIESDYYKNAIECHKITVPNKVFTRNEEFDSTETIVVSHCRSGEKGYSQLLYNFGVSMSDTGSEANRCISAIETCCQNKCSSTSNECYNKCTADLY